MAEKWILALPEKGEKNGRKMGNGHFWPISGPIFPFFPAIFPPFSGRAKIHFLAIFPILGKAIGIAILGSEDGTKICDRVTGMFMCL